MKNEHTRFIIDMQKNKNGKWFWRLIGRNGRIMAHSEEYSSKTKCEKTADLMFLNLKNCQINKDVRVKL